MDSRRIGLQRQLLFVDQPFDEYDSWRLTNIMAGA
jgi:hypothetical protein